GYDDFALVPLGLVLGAGLIDVDAGHVRGRGTGGRGAAAATLAGAAGAAASRAGAASAAIAGSQGHPRQTQAGQGYTCQKQVLHGISRIGTGEVKRDSPGNLSLPPFPVEATSRGERWSLRPAAALGYRAGVLWFSVPELSQTRRQGDKETEADPSPPVA